MNDLLTIDLSTLDQFMPMHVLVSATGHITRVGPTLARLRPEAMLCGMRFLEVFELRRPRKDVQTVTDLQGITGTKLRLQFRNAPQTALKGVMTALPDDGGMLVNLSFGISLVEAVRTYSLTNSDFAPTDLAIELLYLVEAKTAVLDESRSLNMRLQRARQTAEVQATTDTLTGLCNRRALDDLLLELIDTRRAFGLMHLDLDFFKHVNDTYGHAAGDHVLQVASAVLTEETREVDTVARVGGDEFVLIFNKLVDEGKLMKIAERIVTRLEEPVPFQGDICQISGSIGITTSEKYDAPDIDRMMGDADAALYESKRRGRACATMVNAQLLAAQ